MRRVRATFAYSRIRVLLAAMMTLLTVVALPAPARSTEEVVPPQSDLLPARAALAAQIELHPILEGVTVEMSDSLDAQAVAYYTQGRIVISGDHTAGIERIIEHEVWHVIDWRDNGRIDWGESVPPSDSST